MRPPSGIASGIIHPVFGAPGSKGAPRIYRRLLADGNRIPRHPPAPHRQPWCSNSGSRHRTRRRIIANNRHKAFEATAGRNRLLFPYAKAAPRPASAHPVRNVYVDNELGREAFTYVLDSGREGTVHLDYVLEYNENPRILRDLLHGRGAAAIEEERAQPPRGHPASRNLAGPVLSFARPDQLPQVGRPAPALLRVLDCDVRLVVRDRLARSA
jgi:hypothetical protein